MQRTIHKRILFTLFVTVLVALHIPGSAFSQDNKGLGPYAFIDGPTSAEINIIRLEDAGKYAKADAQRLVIAIGRLGTAEISRKLNRRRLHNIREFFSSYTSPDKIVVAEGEKRRGFGGIELYIGGKLIDVLLAERNKDLLVDCCEDNDRYYPDKGRPRRHL